MHGMLEMRRGVHQSLLGTWCGPAVISLSVCMCWYITPLYSCPWSHCMYVLVYYPVQLVLTLGGATTASTIDDLDSDSDLDEPALVHRQPPPAPIAAASTSPDDDLPSDFAAWAQPDLASESHTSGRTTHMCGRVLAMHVQGWVACTTLVYLPLYRIDLRCHPSLVHFVCVMACV